MASHSEASTTEDYAVELARFAGAVSATTLPAPVLAAAKANVFDTLACLAAGSSAAAVPEARGLATAWGGAPQATILVFGDRIPAHHAAWVNGTMAHARDYDDLHTTGLLHAGVCVVPAALAAAELAGASGADFISGVAAGLEASCRLGVANRLGLSEGGFLYTALFGYFGATVAATRVLKLDPAQTVNALGIAYSMVSGNHQVTLDAALTKRMQPGFAAMSALLAVQLTQRGVRGVQATFDGADGFLRVYLRGKSEPAALRDGLGQRFDFTQLSYKAYPCCGMTHNAIDAALALRPPGGQSPDGVRRIRVGLNRQGFEVVGKPNETRNAPRTIVQAQFSIPYTVAAALIDGPLGLGHFTEPALQRRDILALAARIESYVDDGIEREFGRNISPAVVEMELEDGTTRRQQVTQPLGHPAHPMSAADFDRKAQDCFGVAARPLAGGASELRRVVDQLEQLADVRALVRALTPAD